jgi:pimeloyl-ACP methyl ester carboxylesterase
MSASNHDASSVSSGITAVVSGHGADVVLVHGAMGDYRQWDPIARHLQTRFRVSALSRRYHWPNPPPAADAQYTYESQRDDLLEFLRLHTGRVHLVGHSYGAGIVLLAALSRPWHVETLSLIEPAFSTLLGDAVQELASEIVSRNAMLTSVQSMARAGRHEEAARVLTDWLQGSRMGFTGLPAHVQDALLENALTVGPAFVSPAPEVTCEHLHECRVPSLVVHGEGTRAYYRVIAERAASCLPEARLERVPGAGHMSIVERPEQIAALLEAFLTDR